MRNPEYCVYGAAKVDNEGNLDSGEDRFNQVRERTLCTLSHCCHEDNVLPWRPVKTQRLDACASLSCANLGQQYVIQDCCRAARLACDD